MLNTLCSLIVHSSCLIMAQADKQLEPYYIHRIHVPIFILEMRPAHFTHLRQKVAAQWMSRETNQARLALAAVANPACLSTSRGVRYMKL